MTGRLVDLTVLTNPFGIGTVTSGSVLAILTDHHNIHLDQRGQSMRAKGATSNIDIL